MRNRTLSGISSRIHFRRGHDDEWSQFFQRLGTDAANTAEIFHTPKWLFGPSAMDAFRHGGPDTRKLLELYHGGSIKVEGWVALC